MRISDWSSDVCSSDLHLGQNLIERLLLLARSADRGLAPGASYSIDFVDEDDGRCVLARFREQVPDACGTDSNDHFEELGTAHRQQGPFDIAGDATCQVTLPCPPPTHPHTPFRGCPPLPGLFHPPPPP